MKVEIKSQTEFSLVANDGARIAGVCHSPQQPTKVAVVLVHGLTGHMCQYLHIMLGTLLARAGFAVFRFDQYGDEDDQRKFHTSTIRSHVADTKTVIEYVRSLGFEKVVLAGHSLGAPIAVEAADTLIAGLILLDPSGDPKDRINEWQVSDERRGSSFLDWRTRTILGEAWVEDARTFPDPYERLSQLECPVCIVAAERAEQMKFCERYRDAHVSKPDVLTIAGATHCFTEEGVVEDLGDAMAEWLQKSFQF